MIKKAIYVFLAIIAVLLLPACAGKSGEPYTKAGSEFEQLRPIAKGDQYAVITTSEGVIKIRLFPEYAPKAVENFVALAESGYYNGVIFHRVIKDFMIQSGDPEGTGTGGESIWGEPFEREMTPRLHHIRGALGMAKTDDPISQGSQFYIVQNNELDSGSAEKLRNYLDNQDNTLGDNSSGTAVYTRDLFQPDFINAYLEAGGAPHLDYGYTVFGQVFEGMAAVDKIAAVKTDGNDKPEKDITIQSIEIKIYE